MAYIDAELITDETANAEAILAALADRIDDWEPSEGSFETDLAEAVGMIAATIATLVQEEERKDFASFGTRVLNRPRGTAQVASATSTWTFTEVGSYVIPDGSEVVRDLPDGTPVAFATVGDVAVTDAAAVFDVPLVALEPGSAPNGLSGPGRDFEALPFVAGVELGVVSGGADAEDRDAYLARIADRARRVKVAAITVDDYAAIPLDHPAVARCLAVRLLDPTDPPTEGELPSSGGHITVFPADAAGSAMSAPVKLEIVALLEGEDRPLAVTVHVGDPEYTPLTVAASIRLALDADEEATKAAVAAAISTYLDPAVYGIDETAPGRWRPPLTGADRVIRNYDIATVAAGVAGVAGVVDVTINGGDEVELTGWAPLPQLTAPPTITAV